MKRIALIGLLLASAAQAQTTGQDTSWRPGDRMAGSVGTSPQGQAIVQKVQQTNASGVPVPAGTSGDPIYTSGGSATPTGTAGNPNPNVVTVQGVAGGTPQPTSIAAGSDITEGTLTDAAFAGGTGAATLSALNRGQYNLLTNVVANQTNGAQKTAISVSATGASDSVSNAATGFIGTTAGSSALFMVGGFGFNRSTGSWDRQTTDPNAIGAIYTVPQPVATASAGAAYTAVQGTASVVLKASPGNLYAINLVNSTAAGFVIAYNGTAIPASGTALTAANAAYCYQVAASTTLDKVFPTPVAFTAGVTLLLSTSCTTYTPVGTAPILFSGQVK